MNEIIELINLYMHPLNLMWEGQWTRAIFEFFHADAADATYGGYWENGIYYIVSIALILPWIGTIYYMFQISGRSEFRQHKNVFGHIVGIPLGILLAFLTGAFIAFIAQILMFGIGVLITGIYLLWPFVMVSVAIAVVAKTNRKKNFHD